MAHATELDSALALVCAVRPRDRSERRADVQAVIARAPSVREAPRGVALVCDGGDETARLLLDFILAERVCCARFVYSVHFEIGSSAIGLHIEADGQLIEPLKSLYLTLALQNDAQR